MENGLYIHTYRPLKFWQMMIRCWFWSFLSYYYCIPQFWFWPRAHLKGLTSYYCKYIFDGQIYFIAYICQIVFYLLKIPQSRSYYSTTKSKLSSRCNCTKKNVFSDQCHPVRLILGSLFFRFLVWNAARQVWYCKNASHKKFGRKTKRWLALFPISTLFRIFFL
jgi:hypothetical protein